MFESYKSTNHHLVFTNEIGVGSKLVGNLEGNGNVRIAGQFTGDVVEAVDSKATLYIDKTGVLSGDISYSNLIVAGAVKGAVIRYKTLDIHPDARVNGLLSCEGLDEAQINSSDVINFGLTKKLAR